MKVANNFRNSLVILAEVLTIAFVAYRESATYYSFDVFYCIPIIHAAKLTSLRALRRSDKNIPIVVGAFVGIIWTTGEYLAVYPDYPWTAWLLNTFARGVTFTVLGRVMVKVWRERAYARKDVLTDLANRLEFTDRFAIEQSKSERSHKPYSLVFIDIDQFKLLNDEHGHQVGDEALKVLSGILTGKSRAGDVVARFGGDEFALLFPETDEASCAVLADRILAVAKTEFQARGWPISLSIGCVTALGKNQSISELLNVADREMYVMKKNARIAAQGGSSILKEINLEDIVHKIDDT